MYLSPHLRQFLHREPPSLASETAILSCLKPPLPKSIFYEGLEHAQNIGDILLKSSGKKEQIVHGGRYPGTAQSGSLANLEDILVQHKVDPCMSKTLFLLKNHYILVLLCMHLLEIAPL